MIWQQLNETLGKPFSGGAWSDHAFEQAIAMMQELTPAEFAELRSAWPCRPSEWRVRCADVLPWAPVTRREIVSVLLEMTQAADDDLAISAADTLREFDPATVAAMMTPTRVDRLLEVADRNPGLSAGAIHRLLDGLPGARRS